MQAIFCNAALLFVDSFRRPQRPPVNPLLTLGFYTFASCARLGLLRSGFAGSAGPAPGRNAHHAAPYRQGLLCRIGDRRGGAQWRHPGPPAGRDRPGGERPARSGLRRLAPLAVDGERRGPGQLLRHQGPGGCRSPRHAGARGAVDRRRLHAGQPDAPPRLPSPAWNRRSSRRPMPAMRRGSSRNCMARAGDWSEGGGAVSLGYAGPGGRLPAQGAGGLAGGAADRQPGRPIAAGPGLGRHDATAASLQ